MSEQELLVDCLQRLNRLGLEYFLTGSMASNYWGIPRTTHDLDFVIQFPVTEVARVVAAFEGDFFLQEVSVRGAFRPPFQFNAIDTRSALKVDFWLLRDDPFSQSMFARRVQVTIFTTPAWLAGDGGGRSVAQVVLAPPGSVGSAAWRRRWRVEGARSSPR